MPFRRQPSIGFAFSFVISETGPVTGWWLVSTHESGWMAVTEHTRMTTMTSEQLLEAALDGKLDIDGGAITGSDTTGDEDQNTLTQQPPANTATQTDDEPVGAPIASKSGGYTIAYSKLTDARDERDKFKAEAEALRAQLAALSTSQQANLDQAQQDAAARAQAGNAPTQADQNLSTAEAAIGKGVDVSIFGDFSEEALAAGIVKLQQQTRDELLGEVRQALAPIRQKEQDSAADAHLGAIYKAHPDADEVAESAQFQAWRDGLPSFMRAGVENALKQGTTAEVVEVFTTFKTQTGKAPAVQQRQEAPEVQRRIPASLSEISGAAPVDEVAQVLHASSNPQALLDRMDSMTPEQREALMSRI